MGHGMETAEEREALEQSLEHHKDDLRAAVRDLGVAARSWSDPATSIREHPIIWLAGAFLMGAWLGRDHRVVIDG